jgi:hypothetical protein
VKFDGGEKSDPIVFPSWKRSHIVHRFIENEADFSDIRLLTTLSCLYVFEKHWHQAHRV